MTTIWDESSRCELRTRFGSVAANTSPSWGRMTAPQMVTHVADSVRMALGELPCTPKRSPLRYWPMKPLRLAWTRRAVWRSSGARSSVGPGVGRADVPSPGSSLEAIRCVTSNAKAAKPAKKTYGFAVFARFAFQTE